MNHTALLVLKTITTVWSFGLFLSPAPTVYRIHKAKATGKIPFVPFVAMFCNYHVWSMYSLFAGDIFPLFCTMFFAEIMGLVYAAGFAFYAQDKKQVLKTVSIASIPISLITLYAVLAWTNAIPQSNSLTVKVLGYAGIVSSCLFFASPLMKVRTVIQTRSAASIIAPLCIMGGIGNALWIVYSSAAGDMFVLVPNSICLFLNAIQVFLYFNYNPNKAKGVDSLPISIEVSSKAEEFVIQSPSYHAALSPLGYHSRPINETALQREVDRTGGSQRAKLGYLSINLQLVLFALLRRKRKVQNHLEQREEHAVDRDAPDKRIALHHAVDGPEDVLDQAGSAERNWDRRSALGLQDVTHSGQRRQVQQDTSRDRE